MPSPAASNSDLALWIAGLGFLSSLIVVAINSIVTLKIKNKDVQLKKDEQAYGYKMEYYKRKLTTGEKTIGKLSLTLNMLTVLKNYFLTLLESENPNADILGFKYSLFEKIREKYHETTHDKDDAYFAYFSPEINYKDSNHFIIRIDKNIDEINDIGFELEIIMKNYNTEINEDKKKHIIGIADELFKNMTLKMQDYITLSDEARDEITTLRENIRKQIEELTLGK